MGIKGRALSEPEPEEENALGPCRYRHHWATTTLHFSMFDLI
jgi:hypothetical protein